MQIIFFTLIAIFYILYFAKMIKLKRQGIVGNLLAKGNKSKRDRAIEQFLSVLTFFDALIPLGSILFPARTWVISTDVWQKWIGAVIALLGIAFFAASVTTMKNNWRAGFSDDQKTTLVTEGIYRISRNPAFVGFDLLYVGCALAYPSVPHVAVAILGIVLFHVQILREERYLQTVFGHEYQSYREKVSRYITPFF